MNIKRKIKRFYKKPHKQYVFHFTHPNPSIDVRNITKTEMKWLDNRMKVLEMWRGNGRDQITEDQKTVLKMFTIHFPERLI